MNFESEKFSRHSRRQCVRLSDQLFSSISLITCEHWVLSHLRSTVSFAIVGGCLECGVVWFPLQTAFSQASLRSAFFRLRSSRVIFPSDFSAPNFSALSAWSTLKRHLAEFHTRTLCLRENCSRVHTVKVFRISILKRDWNLNLWKIYVKTLQHQIGLEALNLAANSVIRINSTALSLLDYNYQLP